MIHRALNIFRKFTREYFIIKCENADIILSLPLSMVKRFCIILSCLMRHEIAHFHHFEVPSVQINLWLQNIFKYMLATKFETQFVVK